MLTLFTHYSCVTAAAVTHSWFMESWLPIPAISPPLEHTAEHLTRTCRECYVVIVANTKVLTLKMLSGKFKGIITVNEFKLTIQLYLNHNMYIFNFISNPNPGNCKAVFLHCLRPGDSWLFCHVVCSVSLSAQALFLGQASWLITAPPLLPYGIQVVVVFPGHTWRRKQAMEQ